ncbi:MAG TPA: exodeoxyribonuclease VII large subunit [Solirubrobacteraceae bacterium]|nr:exodeoxyribonuclease VII large subunit [Solirubrobacteraceae bacterium]
MQPTTSTVATGLAGSSLPGPYPVGEYAAALRQRLRQFTRVQLAGEVWGVRAGRVRVYFELRDARGALPCSIWRDDLERLGLGLADGMRVIAAGGCDYYPGSSTSSPAFSFDVLELRAEGEGDLLAELARLRRRLHAEGLFEHQRLLPRPALPRAIGVICAENGKARDDVLAGLRRRGWAGRLVWAFAPVQDRHAAPAIAGALRDLAAIGAVEVVIVARGGGSLADLQAFCDEMLCRTVALLPVPVIASVGHHTDRTLLDDVAAVSCSTPTHAAEAAVPIDCAAARAELAAVATRLGDHQRRAIGQRARVLAALSRAPGRQVAAHRERLHQLARELGGAGRRRAASELERMRRHAGSLAGAAGRTGGIDASRRASELERLRLALGGHDPARTLARGYALVEDRAGRPLSSAAQVRAVRELNLRLCDGVVPAVVADRPPIDGEMGVAGQPQPAGRPRAADRPHTADQPHAADPAGGSSARR